MKRKSGAALLSDYCRRGNTQRLLEKYIRSCRPSGEDTAPSRAKRGIQKDRFPNLAGFCRFAEITPEELAALSEEYPEEICGIYATLEDEALNSSLPAAILSVYLKKRLGYEGDRLPEEAEAASLQVLFEHDVMEDGQ